MPFLRSLEDVDRKSIFLSHSSKDRTAVEGSVLPVLDDAGLSPWYSASDIHSAHDWEVAIRSNLIRCQWFAVVLTPQSIKSDWVKAEVNWAMDNRPGRILPILLQPCEPFELHLRLSLIQYIAWNMGRDAIISKIQAMIQENDQAAKGAEPPALAPSAADPPSLIESLQSVIMGSVSSPPEQPAEKEEPSPPSVDLKDEIISQLNRNIQEST